MKLVGFAGYSGSGKTTLVEQLVAAMKARGLRVSVLKHAHHAFDIDQPGKDSWRHRQAGAHEVLVASGTRMALMREFDSPSALNLQALLDQLDPRVDWVLVEGSRPAPSLKLRSGALWMRARRPGLPATRAIPTFAPWPPTTLSACPKSPPCLCWTSTTRRRCSIS